MADEQTLPRPSQVTLAAGVVIVGSIFVVLSVWDRIAGLHSLESRQAVQDFLSSSGNGLGMSVDDVLMVIKVASMIAAACATAAVILGVQVLQRSRSARVALTVVAVPLFVTGFVTAGLLASGVAAAATMLWLQPARDWFAGRKPVTAPTGPPPLPSVPSAHEAPRPPVTTGYDPGRASYVVPGPPPYAPAPPVAQRHLQHARRPDQVVWACAVTWALSGLAVVAALVSALALAGSGEDLVAQAVREHPSLDAGTVDPHAVVVLATVFCGVAAVWALAACVVAVFVFRGARWARGTLLGSAIATSVLSALGVLASVVMVVPLAGALVTVRLLLHPAVGAWLGTRRPPRVVQ